MEMTQDQYTLYTGQTVNCSDEDWEILLGVAIKRLASFLCLETFPELGDDNTDLAMLLANFLCATLKFQGAQDSIESKSVRNFTINFKSSATNAFKQIYNQYEDIIDYYSQCGTEIKVERNCRHCCGFYNNGYINF